MQTHPKAAPLADTEINPGGLTYRRKPGGSPFCGGAGRQGQAMSCLLCGLHRPRALLRTRVLVGKRHVVCAPSCAALAAALRGAEVAD